jgi:nitrate/TMAO reductase-like tetraheme cytochrome c subunit
MKAKFEGLRHLAAYLYDKKAPLPIRPVVKDGACLSSGCHGDRKFEEKEIKFAEKARFKHKVHLTDKALDGQKITCDTCHFKVSENKHFEVPKEICFLCHLKLESPTLDKAITAGGQSRPNQSVIQSNVTKNILGEPGGFQISFNKRPKINFNEGKSRCDICHTIPTRSLQAQLKVGDSLKGPITHQSIKKAGVACESCHFEVIKGHGEIETGNVVSNGCLRCHNRSEKLLTQAKDKTLMHGKHVPAKADCFDCHKVVEHRNRTDHLDFVRNDCSLCHEDQHKYQKILLAGIPVNNDVSATPHLMYKVNVNCMACHTKKTKFKGHSVRTASGQTCAACHKPGHEKMLLDWKNTMTDEVKGAEEVEKEAVDALAAAKDTLGSGKLKKAEEMIANGRELLNIVRFGNGVHNKKYSINILDQSIGNFEDAIELVEEGG